jgi:O-antigen/teichoic acid export membrane protein
VLFSFWVAAGIGAMLVGLWQLWATTRPATSAVGVGQARHRAYGYLYHPRWQPTLVRQLLTVGLANHVLTVCERVPGLMLPVVVTELISAEANAVWYIVWMSAWVVFTAPISIGIALFAEAANLPENTARATATAMRTSLLYAGCGAVVLAVLAHPILRLLGPHYADAGVTPLRLLLLGVLPLAVVSAYYAQCRARGRLGEAIAAGVVAGVAGVAMPAAAGIHYGLSGMALAWVAVQAVVACWAGVRLWTAR